MVKKNAILHFSPELVDKPVLAGLIRNHQVEVNLLQADINADADGAAFVQLEGEPGEIQRALDYLTGLGVRLTFPAKNLIWDEARCTHCGICVAQCLVKALSVDPATSLVRFDHSRCLACELCIPACPYRALGAVGGSLTGAH